MAAPASTPSATSRRWAGVYWPFRIVVTIAAVLLFNQAVFAGQFLAGTFAALNTHRENATTVEIAVAVAAIAAVPIRWPGRGPVWPALACVGLFGLIELQIKLGFTRQLTLHIPLGVAIIAATVLLTVWAWRKHPAPADPAHTQLDAPAGTQGAP